MTGAGWSEAPPDLLWNIIERLSAGDHIRFGAVCTSWRVALSENRRPPPPQAPWFMIDGASSAGLRFFSLSENKDYLIHLPPETGHECIGSSNGWLITASHSSLHIFDPSSRTHASLPSTAAFPHFHKASLLRFAISPPPSPRLMTFTAAATSVFSKNLMFARQGDYSWTVIEPHGIDLITDIIFYEEQLLVVGLLGAVVAYHLSDLSLTFRSSGLNGPIVRNLVESSGDLLQVFMEKIGLRVYKMFSSDKGYEWVEMKCLGDHALFLGHHHSLALPSCPHSLEPKGNSIYMWGNNRIYVAEYATCGFEVREMDGRTFMPCDGWDSRVIRYTVWFLPTITQHIASQTHRLQRQRSLATNCHL